MPNEITFPTIHLNGDNAATLMENHDKFWQAITAALDALPEVNGRNYYPQGPAAFHGAMAMRRRWAAALQIIQTDQNAIMEHIYEANK